MNEKKWKANSYRNRQWFSCKGRMGSNLGTCERRCEVLVEGLRKGTCCLWCQHFERCLLKGSLCLWLSSNVIIDMKKIVEGRRNNEAN